MRRRLKRPTRAQRTRYTSGIRAAARRPMLRMLALVSARLKRVQEWILAGLRERADADFDANFLGARLKGLTRARIEELLDLESYDGALDSIASGMLVANTDAVTKLVGIAGLDRFDPGLVEAWKKENADLIVTLCKDQVADLRANILDRNQGVRVEEIRQSIMERFGVSQSRADLIARDQTLKLNGQMSRENYKRAGLNRYVWTTTRDERVREEHEALDGQEFSFDDPPEPGNPGDDFQCRCTAFPVLDFSAPEGGGEDE